VATDMTDAIRYLYCDTNQRQIIAIWNRDCGIGIKS